MKAIKFYLKKINRMYHFKNIKELYDTQDMALEQQ
jgi:hypothetical protein